MRRFGLVVLSVALTLASVATARSQETDEAESGEGPRVAIVSIYHVAPGKHLEFLKWMAAREEVDKSLGLEPGRWYAHMDGASWDFVAISPERTDEEDARIDKVLREKGLTTHFAAALELRHLISSHSDTFAAGPYTASELVAAASP